MDFRAQIAQKLNHGVDICNVGNIFNAAHLIRKDCCGNNCNRGIFCAADLDFSY